MKLIQDDDLKRLLIDSETLRRLEAMGVDNWVGYEMAIWNDYGNFSNSLKDWEDVCLPNLLEEFSDFTPSDFTITFTEPFYKNYLEWK